MKVLLLGASGFVGKHLYDFLNYQGHEVYTISLRDQDWKNHFKIKPEIIINLVGKAHDHKGEGSENDYYYANVELTKEIFNLFLHSHASILIHISSIAAVEEFESRASLTEEVICNPVSYYGKSKRAAEVWLLKQIVPKEKKIIILRPPMIHGPGDKGNLGLLYKFISKGLPYPLSKYNNTRSFLSINNFNFYIDSLIKDRELIGSGVYHISDDNAIATKDIIAVMGKVANKRIIVFGIPKGIVALIAKLGDVLGLPLNSKRLKKLTSSLIVSNRKINSVLNISHLPESTDEGVARTVTGFKNSKN